MPAQCRGIDGKWLLTMSQVKIENSLPRFNQVVFDDNPVGPASVRRIFARTVPVKLEVDDDSRQFLPYIFARSKNNNSCPCRQKPSFTLDQKSPLAQECDVISRVVLAGIACCKSCPIPADRSLVEAFRGIQI
jgi:hypothetical protein